MTQLKAVPSAIFNDQGELEVTLPISKEVRKFRKPKGRDLKALNTFLSAEGQQPTSIDTLEFLAALLSTDGMTSDQLLDMDAEDTSEVSKAIEKFRVFSTNKD